jgi:lantibiotic biosynthesis protein
MSDLLYKDYFQMVTSPWQPLLPQPLRNKTLEIVSLVAGRLCDPESTLAVAQLAKEQSAVPFPLDPVALTFGPGGPALACAHLDRCFPGQGWDIVAHRYLDTNKVPGVFFHPALHGGISGLAFILALLSGESTRYQKTRTQLNQRLCAQITQQPGPQAGLRGVTEGDYDLIGGAAGILAYLIMLHSEESYIQTAIESLLTYLVWLAGIDQEHQRERWYVSPEHLVLEEKRQFYPDGFYNCGLAHGMPGPMAALALAWLEGYRVPGQCDALHFLSDWLLRYTLPDAWGINWPDVVSLPASRSTEAWKQCQPTRSAWCYGAPGIARALWLTGLALEQPALCQTAVHALEAVLQRPVANRRIDSPTLCHGVAGLLEICLRFAQETESSIIHAHIPLLVSQILDQFNPDFPLGFRDQERDQVFVDQPAWLNGIPGIVLVLLAAALPVEPTWDRIMLLS